MLDPEVGHEQGGRRPSIILSSDDFNHLELGLVVVVPVTTSARGYPTHVPLPVGAGGLERRSFAMTEQIRVVSVQRFRRRIGRIDQVTMRELRFNMFVLLDV